MPSRKLPPNAVVIADYRSGLSSGQIAERYGVKPITVLSLLRRIGEPRRPADEFNRLRVESGRTRAARYWQGKQQPREMVERRISKIRGENHWLWKGGTSDRREYRQVVEKESCVRCGVTERLAIHHLNGDHYDNRVENLQVLCLPCHSSVHKQAYWDAIHAGEMPPKSNAPIGWSRKGGGL